MASTFLRSNSAYIWIRYKDKSGKWRSASTGYRQDNYGEQHQAKLLAREKTLEELANRGPQTSGGKSDFSEWVIPWIEQRWGHLDTCTPKYYRRYFLRWRDYLGELGVTAPAVVTREMVLGYMPWRKKHGGERNTALLEMKFFGQVLEEAVHRGFIRTNCARKLGIQKIEQEHKNPWTDEEIQRVSAELTRTAKFGWMHVTFLMGLYQAVRLRQSVVPIHFIDLDRGVINYPGKIVKGRKGFSQPIDPTFVPTLKAIMEHRRSIGEQALCTLPEIPSVKWRRFLDTLSLPHLSHHGLRATWCTRAAIAGIPEAQARRYVNHASDLIHQIYQRITATDLAPIFESFHPAPNLNTEKLPLLKAV